jgi:hypothetical protein
MLQEQRDACLERDHQMLMEKEERSAQKGDRFENLLVEIQHMSESARDLRELSSSLRSSAGGSRRTDYLYGTRKHLHPEQANTAILIEGIKENYRAQADDLIAFAEGEPDVTHMFDDICIYGFCKNRAG